MEENNITPKNSGKTKIVILIAILVVIVLIMSYFFMNQGPRPVSLNKLYDDQIDRNNDGVINGSDSPYEWNSYQLGDIVQIRDRINYTYYEPAENKTYFFLVEYSGKYTNNRETIRVALPGNVTGLYLEGDIITIENEMIEYPGGHISPRLKWTLVP